MVRRTGRGRRGLFVVEVVTGIGIVMLVTGALLHVSLVYVRARDAHMLQRTLRLAAQGQLGRCRAGVQPEAPVPEDLLPTRVHLVTTVEPGTGPWVGMTKLTVTAIGKDKRGGEHRVVLSGYVGKDPRS